MELACSLNGQRVVREVEPQELLLDVLRDTFGLTGAKRSCDVQVCGACTVLVDGLPVSSCCYLAVDASGREVTTIEGLARAAGVRAARGGVHPPRRAAVRLLHAGHAAHGQLPARAGRAARGRGGDQAAPRRQPVPLHGLPRDPRGRRRARDAMTATIQETPTQIGRSYPRRDAREKLRGQAQFVGDMVVPRMLHGKVLRSPRRARPHRLDRHVGRGEDPGGRLRTHRRRPRRHRSLLRARDQGPADRRDRQGALPRASRSRPSPPRRRPPPRPASRRSRSSTRSCR